MLSIYHHRHHRQYQHHILIHHDCTSLQVLEPFGGRDGAKALRKQRGYGKYAVKEEEKEDGEGEGEKIEKGDGDGDGGEEGKDGESGDAAAADAESDEQHRAAREEIERSRKRAFGQLYVLCTSVGFLSFLVCDVSVSLIHLSVPASIL
jgi:hypothetical protein